MNRVVEPIPVGYVGVVRQWVSKRLTLVKDAHHWPLVLVVCGREVDQEPPREPLLFWVSLVERPTLWGRPPSLLALFQVPLRDLLEAVAELGGQVGKVPEHVPEFLGE